MLRGLAIALFLAFFCGAAGAQLDGSSAPLMGTGDDGVVALPEDAEGVTEVLVIGDAIGGGLGAGLTRMAESEGNVTVTNRFNEESGLARPEVYDWNERLPKILEGKSFEAIVAMIGTNDRQQIRSEAERFAFNSPEWIDVYKTRLDQLLDRLAATGAKIYWVSLPPMADAEYNEAMMTITALQKERAEAKGAIFVDIRPALLAGDGSYTDTGPDEIGEVRRLRSRDGITFYKAGNNRMGQIVLEAIKAAKEEEEPQKVSLEAPKEVLDNVARTDIPLFGQVVAGLVMTVVPEDALVAAVSGAAFNITSLKALAAQGSSAATLFETGLMPMPPKGRIDDFSLPPSAE